MASYQACKEEASGVKIDVEDEQGVVKTCGTLQLSGALDKEDQIYEFDCITEGMVVLLSKMGGFTINEIVVIARLGEFENFL